MDQEKIGKLIKELRTKSNLTQKEFADKYKVTYQAVSKWENGKNLPDTLLLKEICNDYNINIDDILDGNAITKKKNNYLLLIPLILIAAIIAIIQINHKEEFEFKTISSNCTDFKLSGSIAYNEKKSVIYISNIEYCGNNENEVYKSIISKLYEKNNNLESIIGTCNHKDNTNITLKEYLKDVSFNVSNDKQRLCKNYSNDNLYLEIEATTKEDKVITFSVPLSIKSC